MATEKIFIAITGNIGAGKTTLTRLLSKHFNWEPHFEVVEENPYLADFYQDMKRWSFPLQIFFLTHRFSAHQEITRGSLSAIQDRSIYEDANIFARNLYEQGQLEERDYKNYHDLYLKMSEYLTPPDLMVYLKKSVPRLQDGIRKRNRDYEKEMPVEYLTNLNKYYDDWMNRYDLGPKLTIEADSLDFVKNSSHFDLITHQICSHFPSLSVPGALCGLRAEPPLTKSSLPKFKF